MISLRAGLSTLRRFQVNSPLKSLTLCSLCLRAAGGHRICRDCLAGLPRNRNPCQRCALPLPLRRTGLCGRCLHQSPAHDTAYAPFLYRFPVDGLITHYKYGGDRALGFVLSEAWLDAFRGSRQCAGPLPQQLIPCPISRRQLLIRGFNQSAELAWRLGKALPIPVTPLLTRTGHHPNQAGLNRRQRLRNLQKAFHCTQPPPLHVALIDDVITTGATAQAMSRALKQAGARQVEIWAMARTP
ncbi:MAG: ComF family protein [Oleiphilaceae bacterium]|nr:ComF family protein [Oleiphilaceae bacterium]